MDTNHQPLTDVFFDSSGGIPGRMVMFFTTKVATAFSASWLAILVPVLFAALGLVLVFLATGIKAANAWATKTYGKEFDRLSPADRAAALTAMEQGQAQFDGFDAKMFFEAVLQSAMEGFFADPIYGGNRNKVSWRMVGYPGLPATWAAKALEYRGKKVTIEPQSIADFS